ncbi:MAG: hypothetical protein LC737_05090, partial [Chloroflexi bacterium]|nr:hypothetical protein [Chloroflexota bacterium]
IVLALFTLVLGAMNLPENVVPAPLGGFLHRMIATVFEESHIAGVAEFEATPFNIVVAGISTAAAVLGLGLGFLMYRGLRAGALDPLARLPGYHFLRNKWYVDELYQRTFVALTYAIANLSSRFDRSVIDATVNTVGEAGRAVALDLRDYFDTLVIEGLVNGAGKLSVRGGQLLRGIQTGHTQNYMLIVVLAVIALAGYRIMGGNVELMLFGALILALLAFGAFVFSRATREEKPREANK